MCDMWIHYFVRKRKIEQSHHFSCVRSKDCNIVNKAICLSTTLLGIRVVVGCWKRLVFAIQLQCPR